jgi:hypothetical protein
MVTLFGHTRAPPSYCTLQRVRKAVNATPAALWQCPHLGKTRRMNKRNSTAVSLFAAGAAAGLALTYVTRNARARMRRPVRQAMTVLVPRDRVEEFIESRDRIIEALGSKRMLGAIERMEICEAPGGRGTEMYLTMRGLGKYAVKDVLRRAKALLETGEIPTGRRYA